MIHVTIIPLFYNKTISFIIYYPEYKLPPDEFIYTLISFVSSGKFYVSLVNYYAVSKVIVSYKYILFLILYNT